MKTISGLGCCKLMIGMALAAGVHAETWDLARDWSDAANPNGVWSYEQAPDLSQAKSTTVATQSGEIRVLTLDAASSTGRTLLDKPVAQWLGAGNADFPKGDQPAWTAGGIPGVFRSTGASAHDMPKNRVGIHAPTVIRWTAPRQMIVDITGGVWMPRDLGRINGVTIGKTSRSGKEASFLVEDAPVPGRPASFNSDHLLTLSHLAKMAHGSDGMLRSVAVEAGDSLWLWIKVRNGDNDFVGVDLSISESGEASAANASTLAPGPRLFPIDGPASQWAQFKAEGFSAPVTGAVYRRDTPATCGVPLGGVDTGCIDFETSGLWGYSTIFNTHIPRRGPINTPMLGLSVGGQTWVLCDPDQTKPGQGNFQPPFCYYFPQHQNFLNAQGKPMAEPYVQTLPFATLKTAREIHYWGHYPVADLEFETDAPVQVGMRAWSPFFPGDVKASAMPAAAFDVHLRNTSGQRQKGSVAFSFPGPTVREGGTNHFARSPMAAGLTGTLVESPKASYVLAVQDEKQVRLGGDLADSAEAWGKLGTTLPQPAASHGGSSVAVDFDLAMGETKVVRYVLAWSAPEWNVGGKNWSSQTTTYKHMYARFFPDAKTTAQLMAKRHGELLSRVLAWQQVVYSDKNTPGWLADSLINVLHLIAETGMWAQSGRPLGDWVRPEDGLFGMNECPRTCPQIECIPCGFYGNLPLVYFFPELALSTYRGYAAYQFDDGAAPWVWGGWTGGFEPPVEFGKPARGYQHASNGISLAGMIDRYLVVHGDPDGSFVREFYPMVKRNLIYTMNLSQRKDFSVGQRAIAMPDHDRTEWFEAGNPAWFGMTAHMAGLRNAQIQIGERLAKLAGDPPFEKQCQEWRAAASEATERDLWNGGYYLNCFDPVSKQKDDLVFGYQLDGQWINLQHGLKDAFPKDRVKTTLQTIRDGNAKISTFGVVNYAHADGSPAPVGGYGTYSYFPPELLMLAMTYMYEGDREFGIDLAKRCWENIVCRQRYTWDMPNVMRGDQDTGERGFYNGGHDYYQNMILWHLPAALAGQDLGGPAKPNGLVERVIQAAK